MDKLELFYPIEIIFKIRKYLDSTPYNISAQHEYIASRANGRCTILAYNEKHNCHGRISRVRCIVNYKNIKKYFKDIDSIIDFKAEFKCSEWDHEPNFEEIAGLEIKEIIPDKVQSECKKLKGRYWKDTLYLKSKESCSTIINIKKYKLEKFLSIQLLEYINNKHYLNREHIEYYLGTGDTSNKKRREIDPVEEKYTTKFYNELTGNKQYLDLEYDADIDTNTTINLSDCDDDTTYDLYIELFDKMCDLLEENGELSTIDKLKKMEKENEYGDTYSAYHNNEYENTFPAHHNNELLAESIWTEKIKEISRINRIKTKRLLPIFNKHHIKDISLLIINYIFSKPIKKKERIKIRVDYWKMKIEHFFKSRNIIKSVK